MSKTRNCPKCRGKMTRESIEVETSDTGVLYWRIRAVEPVAYICSKCGYIELFDKGRMSRGRK